MTTWSRPATRSALFAGDGRLIVVDGVEAWKADDAKAIAAYLKAPAPATTLALVGGELKKDAPLAKAVAAAGEVLHLGRRADAASQAWVAEQFKLHGASAEPEACRALIELVGDDLYELATEVDKLAVWAAGDRVTLADVETLVAARAEATSFALTDAWGARDVASVLDAAEALLERSGDPRSRTIPRVVGILTSHVARVRTCQALEAEGLSAKDAAGRHEAAPVLRPEALRAGAELQPGRAPPRDGPPRRARPRAEGRLAPPARARARARADRRSPPPRA